MLDNYHDLLTTPATWRVYVSSLRFAVIVWAITLFLGFNIAWFLVFHVRSRVDPHRAVPAVRHTVLDLRHHPHHRWIPFLGRNGAFNQLLMALHLTQQTAGFPAVLRLRRHHHLCPPVHAADDRPDRQFAGEDRSGAAGGSARRRRQPLAHHGRRGDPAIKDRHRARLDPGVHPGDGRLFRGPANERRTKRLDRFDAVDRRSRPCSIRPRRPARWCW